MAACDIKFPVSTGNLRGKVLLKSSNIPFFPIGTAMFKGQRLSNQGHLPIMGDKIDQHMAEIKRFGGISNGGISFNLVEIDRSPLGAIVHA
jgi:hypothetical protein